MEETGTSVLDAPQTEEQIQQAANKAELDRMMSINLNGGIEPAPKQEKSTPESTPITNEPPPLPSFDIIKEKFNYQSPEDAIKEIEELRALKTATPSTPEYEFENEESKKIFLALTKGDKKEAFKILAEQEKIDNMLSMEITKDNAADIIKLGIQLKNKDLSPQEIEFEYKENYTSPKEPVQKVGEDDEDFKERHDQWKENVERIDMKRVIAAKMAKPELELAKTKIVFPEIEDTVDEGYLQYRKMLAEQPKLDAEISEAYKKITPKNIETKIKFTDEPNKIDFEFQHEPDGESFQKTIDIVSDFNKLVKAFEKPDGTPDREGFAKAMYFALNSERVLTEAMKQSKNATIKAFLPDNNGGTQRQFPQTQPVNEVDEMMRLHGIKRA